MRCNMTSDPVCDVWLYFIVIEYNVNLMTFIMDVKIFWRSLALSDAVAFVRIVSAPRWWRLWSYFSDFANVYVVLKVLWWFSKERHCLPAAIIDCYKVAVSLTDTLTDEDKVTGCV